MNAAFKSLLLVVSAGFLIGIGHSQETSDTRPAPDENSSGDVTEVSESGPDADVSDSTVTGTVESTVSENPETQPSSSSKEQRLKDRVLTLTAEVARLTTERRYQEAKVVQKDLDICLQELDPDNARIEELLSNAAKAHLSGRHDEATALRDEAAQLDEAIRKRYGILRNVNVTSPIETQTGSGSNPNDPAAETPAVAVSRFSMQYAKAADIARVLNEQFEGAGKFSAEPTTNCIYGRVEKSRMAEVRDFIKDLDRVALTHLKEEEKRRQIERDRQAEEMQIEMMNRRQRPVQSMLRRNHMKASDLVSSLQSLGMLQRDLGATVAGPQSVLLRGSDHAIDEARELSESLDIERPRASALSSEAEAALFNLLAEEASLAQQLGDNHPQLITVRKRIEAIRKADKWFDYKEADVPDADAVRTLQQQYEDAERSAAQLAVQLRSVKDRDPDKTADVTQQLTKAVSQAFEFRLRLQEAQLSKARHDLVTAQSRLDRRRQLADRIIERRVEELENGSDLSWLPKNGRTAPPDFDSKDENGIAN